MQAVWLLGPYDLADPIVFEVAVAERDAVWRVLQAYRDIPWIKKWQSTPVFLPGGFHGQRSLVGYSPCGCKESNTSQQLTYIFINTLDEFNLN